MKMVQHTPKKQPAWQRMTLLSILAYEGLGSIGGGGLLIAAPDGRLMQMPVEIMHGAFADFLVPGIILFALGILNIAAFFSVLQRKKEGWLWVALATGALTIWFWVEIAILGELHWLHAMWGLPVVAAGIAVIPLIPRSLLQQMLLFCGILSSALYIAINVIVPLQWSSYSVASQTVSELSAIDAPTRMLWNVLVAPYAPLLVAFGIGVSRAAGENRRLRWVGWLLIVYGALGVLWPFAPMHQREALAGSGGTLSDTLHISLGAVTELLYLAALVLTATATRKFMRSYAVITFFLVLVFGILTFRKAPGVAANQSTPLMGIWERVNIGIFLAWIVVLSGYMWKRPSKSGR